MHQKDEQKKSREWERENKKTSNKQNQSQPSKNLHQNVKASTDGEQRKGAADPDKKSPSFSYPHEEPAGQQKQVHLDNEEKAGVRKSAVSPVAENSSGERKREDQKPLQSSAPSSRNEKGQRENASPSQQTGTQHSDEQPESQAPNLSEKTGKTQDDGTGEGGNLSATADPGESQGKKPKKEPAGELKWKKSDGVVSESPSIKSEPQKNGGKTKADKKEAKVQTGKSQSEKKEIDNKQNRLKEKEKTNTGKTKMSFRKRVLLYTFVLLPVLMVVALAVGLMIGYGAIGGDSALEVFTWELWEKIYDLIYG
ncbi:DNA-directed RNA polymerase subunit beta [Kroppenstedtia pulmonis]|uniref:DNA-directed RNA polymerase subunit beta n=1 Tax=Kroppenstedtia pulmonis TaxID=1380685 RepID=A0A7D4CX60_9BACL|nr:DNA-directed RNA polymerase subunit beta [Kroppenstedtia pulmonis]QKG85697.1 DNA-directed RNA polymerase subunit beta [Kroppenstedtia pulmonis]